MKKSLIWLIFEPTTVVLCPYKQITLEEISYIGWLGDDNQKRESQSRWTKSLNFLSFRPSKEELGVISFWSQGLSCQKNRLKLYPLSFFSSEPLLTHQVQSWHDIIYFEKLLRFDRLLILSPYAEIFGQQLGQPQEWVNIFCRRNADDLPQLSWKPWSQKEQVRWKIWTFLAQTPSVLEKNFFSCPSYLWPMHLPLMPEKILKEKDIFEKFLLKNSFSPRHLPKDIR